MPRVEVPRALCVPGGLPPVCLVRGTRARVSYREIAFDEIVLGSIPVCLWTTSAPVTWLAWYRRGLSERDLARGAALSLVLLAVCSLALGVSWALRRPCSLVLPLEDEAFELWRSRRLVGKWLLRGAHLLLTILGIGGLALVDRLAPGLGYAPFIFWSALPAVLWLGVYPAAVDLFRILFVHRLVPRLVGPRGVTVTLAIPSQVAADAVRAHLEGRDGALRLPPGATCGLHAKPATFVCARCGDFACGECAAGAGPLAALCSECRGRVS